MRLGGFSEFSSHSEIRETPRDLEGGLFARRLEGTRPLEDVSTPRVQEMQEVFERFMKSSDEAMERVDASLDEMNQINLRLHNQVMQMQEAADKETKEIYARRKPEHTPRTDVRPSGRRKISGGSEITTSKVRRPRFDEIHEIKSPEHGLPALPSDSISTPASAPTPTPSQAIRAQVAPQIKKHNAESIKKEALARTTAAKEAARKADISQMAYNAPFEAKLANKSAEESAGVFVDAFQKQAEKAQAASQYIQNEALARTTAAKEAARTADISQMAYNAPFEAKLANKSAEESAKVFIHNAQIADAAAARTTAAKEAARKADISQMAYNAPFDAKLAKKSAAESAEVFVDAFQKQAKRNRNIAIAGAAILGIAGTTAGIIHHINKSKETN